MTLIATRIEIKVSIVIHVLLSVKVVKRFALTGLSYELSFSIKSSRIFILLSSHRYTEFSIVREKYLSKIRFSLIAVK